MTTAMGEGARMHTTRGLHRAHTTAVTPGTIQGQTTDMTIDMTIATVLGRRHLRIMAKDHLPKDIMAVHRLHSRQDPLQRLRRQGTRTIERRYGGCLERLTKTIMVH